MSKYEINLLTFTILSRTYNRIFVYRGIPYKMVNAHTVVPNSEPTKNSEGLLLLI